ncbi:MAG: DM13 domain-containing protein [Candidatus Limnocylindria bacterium]
MPSIGDIANDVAAALYEQRVLVAILSVVGFVVFVVVARRLGWLAAAARHPRRTALAAAALTVVLAPVTWYLASPIFLRTELVEPAPAAVSSTPSPPITTPSPTVAPSPPPAATPGATAEPAAVPTPQPTPTPFAPRAVASGEFQGSDEFHFGRGTATIIEVEPGRYHLRLEDFSVRNGPDLYVYLSPDPDGYDDGALELGLLKATDGSFGYDLPDGADPARFRSAIIWCKQFSHLFATATFER